MFARHAKILFIVLMLAFITTLLLVTTISADPAEAPAASLLWLDPPNPSTAFGTTVDVDIRLNDITNVYGAEMALTFDPAVLEVVDSSVTPGVCPAPDFVATNAADNSSGTINYAVTQLNPTPACNGGVVATITFSCTASDVTSLITFESSIIADADGAAISHNTQDALVECTGGFSVAGSVDLKGWPGGPSGVMVVLKDGSGSTVDSTIVGPTGTFNLSAPNVLDTYSVEASYDRYLTVQEGGITGGEGFLIDVGKGTLPAGDLNGDATVNILDVVMVASNFGKISPQPWLP